MLVYLVVCSSQERERERVEEEEGTVDLTRSTVVRQLRVCDGRRSKSETEKRRTRTLEHAQDVESYALSQS